MLPSSCRELFPAHLSSCSEFISLWIGARTLFIRLNISKGGWIKLNRYFFCRYEQWLWLQIQNEYLPLFLYETVAGVFEWGKCSWTCTEDNEKTKGSKSNWQKFYFLVEKTETPSVCWIIMSGRDGWDREGSVQRSDKRWNTKHDLSEEFANCIVSHQLPWVMHKTCEYACVCSTYTYVHMYICTHVYVCVLLMKTLHILSCNRMTVIVSCAVLLLLMLLVDWPGWVNGLRLCFVTNELQLSRKVMNRWAPWQRRNLYLTLGRQLWGHLLLEGSLEIFEMEQRVMDAVKRAGCLSNELVPREFSDRDRWQAWLALSYACRKPSSLCYMHTVGQIALVHIAPTEMHIKQ